MLEFNNLSTLIRPFIPLKDTLDYQVMPLPNPCVIYD